MMMPVNLAYLSHVQIVKPKEKKLSGAKKSCGRKPTDSEHIDVNKDRRLVKDNDNIIHDP